MYKIVAQTDDSLAKAYKVSIKSLIPIYPKQVNLAYRIQFPDNCRDSSKKWLLLSSKRGLNDHFPVTRKTHKKNAAGQNL